jgi:hypothetical protein
MFIRSKISANNSLDSNRKNNNPNKKKSTNHIKKGKLNILKILIEKDFFLSRDFDLTNREKISIFLQIYQKRTEKEL